MKKKLTILFILISINLFSQSINKTGDKICSCMNNEIENIPFSKKFTKCYNSIVIKNMTLEEKIANDINAIESKHLLLRNYIKNNCVQKFTINNLKSNELESIKKQTCNCISHIKYGLINLQDSINSCIKENIINSLKKHLVDNETTNKFNSKNKTYNLIVDENSLLFNSIKNSLSNCKNYKKLIKKNRKISSITLSKRHELIDKGLKYTANKKYKKALKYFEKYTTKYKDDAEGYFGLGEALMNVKKNEEALRILIKSLVLDSNNRFYKETQNLISEVFDRLKAKNKLTIAKKIMNENNINFEE